MLAGRLQLHEESARLAPRRLIIDDRAAL